MWYVQISTFKNIYYYIIYNANIWKTTIYQWENCQINYRLERALINQHKKDYYPNRKWLKEMKCNLPRRNMNGQEAHEHMFGLIRN